MMIKDRLVDHLKAKQAQIRRKLQDETRFIKALAGNPIKTGAISPSGEALAEKMASYVDPALPLPILELGPGTGAITRGLIAAGCAQEKLHLVEYSAEFSRHLSKCFPAAKLIQGSAYELKRTLAAAKGEIPLYGAVVSSLPLLTQPLRTRRLLLEEALALCSPDAPFIQFSYGLEAPIRISGLPYTLEKSNWILRNMPPARVFVYRKK